MLVNTHILDVALLLLVILIPESTVNSFVMKNVALGKPTKQLGVTTHGVVGVIYQTIGNSSFAVDGIPIDLSENFTCSLTAKVMHPWWMVDLEQVYFVHKVAVTTPNFYNYLNYFVIDTSLEVGATSNQLDTPAVCYQANGGLPSGKRTEISCFYPRMARYIRISKIKDKASRVGLCEVEVLVQQNFRDFGLERRRGKRSTNQIIESFRSVTVTQCCAQCPKFPTCTSVNFQDKTGECQLIEDLTDDPHGNEEAVFGWTRYVLGPGGS